MADVVLTLGADTLQYWREWKRIEQESLRANARQSSTLGNIGQRIENLTGGARKFSGAISSTVGIASSLLGAFSGIVGVVTVVGGLVAGPILVAMRRNAEQARQFRDAMRDIERMRVDVALDAPGQDSTIADRRRAEEESRRLLDERTQRLRTLRDEGKLRREQFEQLYALEGDLHKQRMRNIAEAAKIEEANRLGRYEAERRALQDRAGERVSEFGRRDETDLERLRREHEELAGYIRAVYFDVDRQIVNEFGQGLLAKLRADFERFVADIEAKAAEAERRARVDSRFDDDAIRADIQRLRGDEEGAALARIRLDTEREIERVRRDANLDDEERARRIALLRERSALLEAEASERFNRPEQLQGRSVAAGLLGGAAVAQAALGGESDAVKAERTREEMLDRLVALVDNLVEVGRDVGDIRREGVRPVLGP
jgi:hypothetical protein